MSSCAQICLGGSACCWEQLVLPFVYSVLSRESSPAYPFCLLLGCCAAVNIFILVLVDTLLCFECVPFHAVQSHELQSLPMPHSAHCLQGHRTAEQGGPLVRDADSRLLPALYLWLGRQLLSYISVSFTIQSNLRVHGGLLPCSSLAHIFT